MKWVSFLNVRIALKKIAMLQWKKYVFKLCNFCWVEVDEKNEIMLRDNVALLTFL